jgi:hypothetical protein
MDQTRARRFNEGRPYECAFLGMIPQHLGFCFTRSRASGQLMRKDDTQPAHARSRPPRPSPVPRRAGRRASCALGRGAKRAQAAVPSTAAVRYVHVDLPSCGSPRSIAVPRKTTSAKPDRISNISATGRPNLGRPPSRGTNIVELGRRSLLRLGPARFASGWRN